MPEKQVFEYATIRIVPRVEREEFFNVGVILYCARLQYLDMSYHIYPHRLQAFEKAPSLQDVEGYLQAFEKICRGEPDGGPIAQLDRASRFRWLTATRSTILQTSRVHPGLCSEPTRTLQRLFDEMIGS